MEQMKVEQIFLNVEIVVLRLLKKRFTGDGKVGIGTNDPSHQLHIESSGANTYATMKLEGQNRGGQIDMFQNTLLPIKY